MEMESITTQTTERKMGMKGHPQSNCGGIGGGCGGGGGGGGWMKKKKMAMVAVVILVAVMGVMVVQKVRDRRLFNLVIKDKDRQILSLHLLLQKEKQYAKETKRKNQDLNAKLLSLRIDKTQLNNNILEMRSTITSMQDEQQALESTIHDLQSRINLKQSKFKDFIRTHCSNYQPNLTHNNQTATKNLEPTNNGKHPQNEDLGKLATQILDAKIQNTTETTGRLAIGGLKENGDGLTLTMKKKPFIEDGSKGNQSGDGDKSQVTTKWEEGIMLLKSNNYSTSEVGNGSSEKTAIDEEIKSKGERIDDEDEGEIEADMNASVSDADQDYKEETQD